MTSVKLAFGIFFMLLASTLFAQGTDFQCPSGATKDSQVMLVPSADGTAIQISVLAFDMGVAPPPTASADQMKQWAQECAPAPDLQRCIWQKGLEANANSIGNPQTLTYESLQGAHVRVQYFNPMGNAYQGQWTDVLGCQDVLLDTPGTAYKTTSAGDTVEYTYYYGTCPLSDVLKGTSTTVRAVFIPQDETICPSAAEYSYSNPKPTMMGEFLQTMQNLIRGISQGGHEIGAGGSLPCLGVFLIMGLLLASLYFAGKSPVTLLDITSPRLPAPKGVTAGGQILAPFGYSEMKATTSAKMAASAAAVAKSAENLKNSMRGDADHGKLQSMLAKQTGTAADRAVGKSAAGSLAQGKAMGSSILTLGRSVGMTGKELEPLANKLPYHYGDAEHKLVSRITELAEKKGGREALMAMTIKDYTYGQRTFQTLEVLTGHPEVGQRSAVHAGVMNVVGKFYGPQRYTVIGGMVTATFDSTRRSAEQMKRMTKAIATNAPDLARQTSRSVMELMGGSRSLENLKARGKTSPTAAWMAGQMEKHPSQVVVGNMFPVDGKMGHLYNTLHNEALAGVVCYDMKQLYKSAGVKFNLTTEELASMGHMDMDILKRSGYSSKVAAMEAELHQIITNNALSLQQKHAALLALADAHGAHIDQNATKFAQRLEAIESSQDAGHIKLLSIQQLLEEQNKIRMAASVRDDAFVCHVGGDSLRGSAVWETMVLRTMLWDAENGHLVGGLKEELLSARLNVANRLASLDPTTAVEQLPEHMRDMNQLKAVTERNRHDMLALFTEDGKAQYKQYSHGKAIESASMQDIVKFMYGGNMPRTGSIDRKTGKMMWWGSDMELSLQKGATLVDVKRHWISGLTSQDNIAIGQWVESRFTRSYVPAYKASIEAELNRMPGSSSWTNEQRTQAAKKIWVTEQLSQDMEQRFNSHFGHNAYGTTRETSRFYGGIMAGFMEKALQEKGMESNHPDLRFLQEMDMSSPKHLAKLKELMRTYATEYRSVIGRDMTYDDIARSNKAVVMLHEGGFAYYHKGMMLSDMDRVMAGETTLRDNKGQLRKFIPEEVTVSFGSRDDLTHQYGKVRSSRDTNEWTTFVESTVKWAKEGGYSYDRQKVAEAIISEYRTTTHDYAGFQSASMLSIEAKRQVAPVAPNSLRFFGIDGHNQGHLLKPFRDMGLGVGDYISKVALASGGSLLKTSYDITPLSEYYRQHSFQLSSRIMSDKGMENLTDAERVAYRNAAMQHGAYHQVWDYAIDRNPWRTSTSHGTHQAWAAFFQFGPAAVFKVRDNLRAYMDRGQYANFMVGQGFGMDFAGKLMRPYLNILRGVQMSMQGYASKWDQSDDALKQWNYTPPRIQESFQSLNPFSARWFSGKAGDRIAKLNGVGGSLERHQLAGPDFLNGLKQAPQDIFLQRKGVYASARTGEANPGASFYNYRSELVLDNPMAEYMYRSKESAFMYDKNVEAAAMGNTVRRTVSAEALALRRTQELSSFGVVQNSLFGWANPISFLWHAPVPGFPSALTPRDIVTKYLARSKTGQSGGSFSDGVKRVADGLAQGGSKMLQPHKLAMVVYCPKCGTPNYRGSSCKNSSCRQVQY